MYARGIDIGRASDAAETTRLRHRRRRGRLAALLVGAAALVGTAACGSDQAAGAGENARPAASVDGALVRQETLSVTIRAVGSLEAEARVEVKPETDGHVTHIFFEEGAPVERGQVLVRLDRNKLRAEVQATRAALNRAVTERENLATQLERNDRLLAQGAISQQAYDDLKTRFDAAAARVEEARANLELARQRLEDATIRAPFDGRAGARSFHLGDYVQVGDPLFTVVDDDPLEIQFSVPERYLGRLHVGSPVQISVRNFPERRFRGDVDYVSPYVDSENRTVALKAQIPNPESVLRAGQFANVTLQLEERQTLMVPEAAILPRRDGKYVFRVEGGSAKLERVETGERRRGRVEVLSGLAASDTVVVAGHHRLQDGAPVSVSVSGSQDAPGAAEPAPSS